MPSSHLKVCLPLLLQPSIFPSIRVFSNESVLHIRWTEYWSFSFSWPLSKNNCWVTSCPFKNTETPYAGHSVLGHGMKPESSGVLNGLPLITTLLARQHSCRWLVCHTELGVKGKDTLGGGASEQVQVYSYGTHEWGTRTPSPGSGSSWARAGPPRVQVVQSPGQDRQEAEMGSGLGITGVPQLPAISFQ